MRHAGYTVKVVTLYSGGRIESELQAKGIDLECLNKRGRWDIVRPWFRLVAMLRLFKPDYLLSYMNIANIFAVAARPFVPGMRLIAGIRATNMSDGLTDPEYRLLDWTDRKMVNYADAVICNSQAAAEDYRRSCRKGRIFVVENGINCDQYCPDLAFRSKVRSQFGIPADAKVVGIVARLDPMKDHQTFLHAANRIANLLPNVHFMLVGGGPKEYLEQLKKLAIDLGIADRLTWTGEWRGGPSSIYPAFDVSVSSSAYGEGFSNAIAESMACGLPCAVTDIGDSARIVGSLGVVVPARQPLALADAIQHCLDTDKPDKQIARRQSIMDRFSVTQLLNRTQAVLNALEGRP